MRYKHVNTNDNHLVYAFIKKSLDSLFQGQHQLPYDWNYYSYAGYIII